MSTSREALVKKKRVVVDFNNSQVEKLDSLASKAGTTRAKFIREKLVEVCKLPKTRIEITKEGEKDE